MKHSRKSKRLTGKAATIIALAAVLVAAGTLAVLALLRDTSGIVTEKLESAEVTCRVNGDYTVTNTGNIPALIRVKVIVNKTEDGKLIPGETPGYTVSADWTQQGEYLYYNAIVSEKAGENTTTAPVSFSESLDDDIRVVVTAEAIQAAAGASQDAWDVSFANGGWS